MKRSSLQRKPPPRVRSPLIGMHNQPRGVMAQSGDDVAAVPKRVPVRSRALLDACREIPCQHCGTMDGTVVAAHSNWLEHGKAKGQKADDNRVASLCHGCHSDLDQGSRMSGDERRAMWDAAHERTVNALWCGGLWPEGVPAPR